MFRKILLPIDGTDLSKQAIEHAIGYAKVARADIVAMSISLIQPGCDAVSGEPQAHLSRLERTLRAGSGITEQVAESARRMGVYCDTVECDFAPADDAVIEAYKRYCCDVVFISSHHSDETGGASSFNASLACRVLEKSAIPVLVFR